MIIYPSSTAVGLNEVAGGIGAYPSCLQAGGVAHPEKCNMNKKIYCMYAICWWGQK